MPTKKDPYWMDLLKSEMARHPTWGAGRITKALKQKADRERRDDYPGERWVGKHRARLLADPDWPQDQTRYSAFEWPGSMERGDLPWEATATSLELLRECDQLMNNAWQPSIESVQLFWHVTQAANGAPFWLRFGASSLLMMAKTDDDPELVRAVQWFLAYTPWRGSSFRDRYNKAIERGPDAIPSISSNQMQLYRISGPGLSDADFLSCVFDQKRNQLNELWSGSVDSPPEEQNG